MATNTYVALDKITVSTNTPYVDFTNIPSTYTDLVLICSAATSSGSSDIGLQFNSDTTSAYSFLQIRGNGTTAVSSRSSNTSYAWINWAGFTTSLGQAIVHINNYSNSTTYKTVLSRFGQAANATDSVTATWRNTAFNSTSSTH